MVEMGRIQHPQGESGRRLVTDFNISTASLEIGASKSLLGATMQTTTPEAAPLDHATAKILRPVFREAPTPIETLIADYKAGKIETLRSVALYKNGRIVTFKSDDWPKVGARK